MQIKTYQIGCVLRLGDNTRIAIYLRQGERVGIRAIPPAGTPLLLGGASVCPSVGVTPSHPLSARNAFLALLPAPVTPARPLLQVEDDGGRLFFGSA